MIFKVIKEWSHIGKWSEVNWKVITNILKSDAKHAEKTHVGEWPDTILGLNINITPVCLLVEGMLSILGELFTTLVRGIEHRFGNLVCIFYKHRWFCNYLNTEVNCCVYISEKWKSVASHSLFSTYSTQFDPIMDLFLKQFASGFCVNLILFPQDTNLRLCIFSRIQVI